MDDARALIPALEPLPISATEAKKAVELVLRRDRGLYTGATVVGQVRRWAEQTPDRPALVGATGAVGYRELGQRVAAVQAFLLDQGVRPGAVLAAIGPRSTVSVIVLLALESMGTTYLPVDAAWPGARLTTVLRQSRASHLLTYHPQRPGPLDTVLDTAATDAGVPLLRLPDLAGLPAGAVDTLRTRCTDDGEPRYVFFTSGTTGVPKGALNEHRGMINHLWAKILDTGLGPDEVLAFTAPLTFDIAIWQMLAPFLVGGSIAVLDEHDVSYPRIMVKRLRQSRVTVLELVPTMLAWLVDRAGREGGAGLPDLRCILSTGEELTPQLAERLITTLPGISLVNAYGFTETSDDVTHHFVRASDLDGGRLPVGSPIVNAALYVLVPEDDGWRAAQPGEPGELFVGGLAPGCGYLGDERASRKAFFQDVLDPGSPTGRLYRSGDAVVVDAGVLRYRGRLDRQVKIAGVRMELGEIEAALRRHPGISECAVLTQTAEDDGDRRELVAYYVCRDSAVTSEELRRFLGDALPPAMVPRRWHARAALPVSANGKTDHRALAQATAAGA